jgi:iron complex outermembrane receptor protein
MRFDYHNIYGGKPSGRLGVVSQPLDRTYVKLLYGTAFKAPSPMLLHSVPIRVGDVVGNPDLKPQQVHTVEGQITYQEDYLVASTGLAYSVILNQAEFTQQGLNKIARNTSRMASVSWESELALQYRDRIRSHLSFELQGAVRDLGDTGSYQTRVLGEEPGIYPSYIVRYGARAPLPLVPLRASAEVMYVAERRSSDTNTMENGAPYTLPPYMLLRASLQSTDLELFDRHESTIGLSGTNLLAADGPDPGFAGVDYPLAPRTFFLQLRQEL